jgi:pimeloyl-ACP methyl ester carboxylesterase
MYAPQPLIIQYDASALQYPEIFMNRIAAAVTVGLIALIAVGPNRAQEPKMPAKPVVKEEISFKTFDGVLIKGTFYPSQKGGSAPVVMFLHKLGGNRTQGDWESLAGKLQQKGYAVLAFDFRGHGASTEIDPDTFWKFQSNTTFLNKVDSKKKTISFTEFKMGYIPYLVNDIAAARWDLDNRNDNGQCNTSNIIVVGAEEGAALGFFWMVTEFYRNQIYKSRNILEFSSGVVNTDVAGEDLAGAIWLSFRRTPGLKQDSGLSFPYLTAWSAARGNNPAPITKLRDQVPMWFASGALDKKGHEDAHYMYDSVLHADKAKQKLELTSKKEVPNTNLRGVMLLGEKNLNTDDLIEKFIDIAVKKRPNQAQRKRNASEFKPPWIEPGKFGF